METAGTLPPNFVIGTLADGRSAGDWQVIEMKHSMNVLHDLDRREHQRIKDVLHSLAVPSPPHLIAQLNNRAFEQDYNVILVQGLTVTDFDLNVSLLPVAGKADMGGGLIQRSYSQVSGHAWDPLVYGFSL
ncbi:MAG: hypothetical protein ABI618_07020 [Nitrospirota bacterium]